MHFFVNWQETTFLPFSHISATTMNQDKEQLESARQNCGYSPSPSVSKRPSINHGDFSNGEGASYFYYNQMFSSTLPPTPMNEGRARPEIVESAKDGDIEIQALLHELLSDFPRFFIINDYHLY